MAGLACFEMSPKKRLNAQSTLGPISGMLLRQQWQAPCRGIAAVTALASTFPATKVSPHSSLACFGGSPKTRLMFDGADAKSLELLRAFVVLRTYDSDEYDKLFQVL